MGNEFTDSDRERLAGLHQSILDLKDNMPVLLEVAASRGADAAIEKHAPILEKLTDRVTDVEKAQSKLEGSIRGVKWVVGTVIALAGLLISSTGKIFGK